MASVPNANDAENFIARKRTMDEIKNLVDLIQAGGFVGLLIVLAVPKLRILLGFEIDMSKLVDDIRKDFEYDAPDRPSHVSTDVPCHGGSSRRGGGCGRCYGRLHRGR